MNGRVLILLFTLSATLSVAGCGTQAKLTYSALPAQGADGDGFPFVVPRTVVKVTPSADKSGATESLAFTPVPLATTVDGTAQLPTFVAKDNSSGWSLTPTTVSSVTYLDDLIINAIGTQVSDNRKDAIDVVVTAASLAGAFAAAKEPDCSKVTVPLKPFVIDGYGKPSQRAVPNAKCWAYKIEPVQFNPISMVPHQVTEISAAGTVEWFPIPACKAYKIRVFHCSDTACTSERKDVRDYTTILSLSDGTQYYRIPLPSKGKVSLHTDFCGADTTNESVTTSDWGLLKQLLSDVKSAKGK